MSRLDKINHAVNDSDTRKRTYERINPNNKDYCVLVNIKYGWVGCSTCPLDSISLFNSIIKSLSADFVGFCE